MAYNTVLRVCIQAISILSASFLCQPYITLKNFFIYLFNSYFESSIIFHSTTSTTAIFPRGGGSAVQLAVEVGAATVWLVLEVEAVAVRLVVEVGAATVRLALDERWKQHHYG